MLSCCLNSYFLHFVPPLEAPSPRSQKLWGDTGRCGRVLLTAALTGVELETPAFVMGVTNKTPAFLAMNPLGKARVTTARVRN